MPPKLPALEQAVVNAIQIGLNRDQAAAIAGVSKRTLQRWLADGRADMEQEPPVPYSKSKHRRLAECVEQAEAEFEQTNLQLIQGAAERGAQNWTAAAWLLERKWPERYGKREVVKLEGGDKPLIQLNIGDPKVREVNSKVLDALAKLPAPIEGEVVAEEDA